MIVYAYVIVDADGTSTDPVVAWSTAEDARAAAVSFLADRSVAIGEADELLDWEEGEWTRDGRYPTFTAPTKHHRTVRVWPIEIIVSKRKS